MREQSGTAHGLTSDDKKSKEVNVLVTGFGPFEDAPDTNASWIVANSLPSVILPNPTQPTKIRIKTFHKPITVAYDTVLDLVPQIHESPEPHHIVLHIGVAKKISYYTVEKIAHRDGFEKLDVEGKLPNHSKEPSYWSGLANPLTISANLDDVLARWKGAVKSPEDVHISTDAGRYLCEYLYYTSMAYSQHKGYERQDTQSKTTTVFAHIPVYLDAEWIARDRDTITALIQALVASNRQSDSDHVRETH